MEIEINSLNNLLFYVPGLETNKRNKQTDFEIRIAFDRTVSNYCYIFRVVRILMIIDENLHIIKLPRSDGVKLAKNNKNEKTDLKFEAKLIGHFKMYFDIF